MKKIILRVSAVLCLAASVAVAQEYINLSITNSTPTSPRLSSGPAMLQRAAYQFDLYFQKSAGVALNITNTTVSLLWGPQSWLDLGYYSTATGEIVSDTNGHGRVYLPKDALRVSGDVVFQAVAETATNRASFFWVSSVYETLDKTSSTNVP